MHRFSTLPFVLVALAVPAGIAQSPIQAKDIRIPARFVENRGQFDAPVRYAVKQGGLDIAFADDGFMVAFTFSGRPEAPAAALTGGTGAVDGSAIESGAENAGVRGAAVKFRIVGASPGARLEGLDRAPGVNHYLLGGRRIADVPAYKAIAYRGLTPGVDLVFRESANRRIEFEVHAAPGCDPNGLTFECEGADAVELEADGSLVARTPAGEIRQSAPRAFEVEGAVRQAGPASGFELRGARRFGFAVKGRSMARPLVIDPEITYSTFFGGSGSEAAFGVAADASGNAYVTGYTGSVSLPATTGAFDTTYNGNFDVFVARFRADGQDVDYVTYLGGKSVEQAFSIYVDGQGSATVVGNTTSIDFPTTLNAYDRTFGFGVIYGDAFVTKLDASGSSLVFSTYLGGNGDDVATRVTLGAGGNVYVAGWTRSNNFITPATASSAFDNFYSGTVGTDFGDGFAAVLKNDGTQLLYGTLLGGTFGDAAFGIALDSTGKVYVTGLAGQGFPKKGPAFATYAGNGDCFVTCLDVNKTGNDSLVFSDLLGGSKQDYGFGIALDAADSIFVCGATQSAGFPIVNGSYKTKYAGGSSDGFVFKMNTAGTQLGFSTFLGGTGSDACQVVQPDSAGNLLIGGKTKSGNFPVTPGTFGPKYKGNMDGFLSKLSASGVVLLTSGYLGGSAADEAADIAVLGVDTIWVAGSTLSAGFPVTPDAFDKTFNVQDAFLAKLDMGPAPILCLDSTASIEVPYDVGSPAPSALTRNLTNCGSPESVLDWQIVEDADAPWFSETPASGSIQQGAVAQAVQLALDPTGLAIGAYSTTLRFENVDDSNNVLQVPVLLSVQDIVPMPFLGGEALTGSVPFSGKIGEGTFSAVKGMTLKMKVLGTETPLQPRIQIVNSIGQAVYSKSLANKKAATALSYKFTTDGDFTLVLGGANWSTGDFGVETSVVLPADAKNLTKKNLGSKVDGGPIDLTRRLRTGAVLDVTVDPPKPVSGPLTLTLLDPTGAPVDVAAYTQPFADDGVQLVDVPITTPGLYTIRVTGTATKKEKVNITITPAQPVGTGQIVLP